MATLAVTRRHDLTDAQWAALAPLLPASGKGRPPKWEKRQLIDGIRWRIRIGTPWRDVPAEYATWPTVYGLFRRWQRDGTWDRILSALQAQGDAVGRIAWTVSVDSMTSRAHQHAAGARRDGHRQKESPGGIREEPADHALGRSRGGLTINCSYEAIADATCSATTIRGRRDEWIAAGVFAQLKQIAVDAYDRLVGLVLDDIAVDGCITKAPGGGEAAGRSPVDRGKQGMKRSTMIDGYGIPLGRVLAGANRHDSPLLAPTLDHLNDFGPLPRTITVHLDAGYDSAATRTLLAERGLTGEIAHKGDKAPIQASQRWHVERTNAWHNAFNRLQRCYERAKKVINAFCDLADAIITVRSLMRRAWTLCRWENRPTRRP